MHFCCFTLVIFVIISNVFGGQFSSDGGDFVSIPNSLLNEYISRLDNQQQQQQQQQDSSLDLMLLPKDIYGSNIFYPDYNNYRIRKDQSSPSQQQPQQQLQSNELISHFQTRDDILLPREPVPRKEFLEHSSLFGHQYMQGGAGEGDQHLKPDGSIPNVQVIKSDSVLPAYCNPPNPCPNGYTVEDGCLEEFDNSATFSKEYQSSQECMCDSEHMFNCPGNTDENELETLARSIQNEGLTLDTTLNHIMETMDKNHKVVAKKYFIKRGKKSIVKREAVSSSKGMEEKTSAKVNPFLVGEKLPVVAKKTPHMAKRH